VQQINGRSGLVLVRHRNHTGLDSNALKRAAQRGELVRLRSGAYVRASTWTSLAPDDRIRLEVAAAEAVHRGGFIASHRSAAALWGLPRVRRHDELVHQRVSRATGSRTEHGIRKHAVEDLDLHLTTIDGITVTDVDRTVLDLAATEPFSAAVAAADQALRQHTTKERLQVCLEEWAPARGRNRIQRVIDFADGAAQGPGESISRVQIFESGLTMPVLQQRFDDELGLIGFVDFSWPDFDLIGEFDGLLKYKEERVMAGRSAGEVVSDEKVREDRLRATDRQPRVARWVWATLSPVGRLAAQLRRAGLR
jgi:hypothetical protein